MVRTKMSRVFGGGRVLLFTRPRRQQSCKHAETTRRRLALRRVFIFLPHSCHVVQSSDLNFTHCLCFSDLPQPCHTHAVEPELDSAPCLGAFCQKYTQRKRAARKLRPQIRRQSFFFFIFFFFIVFFFEVFAL